MKNRALLIILFNTLLGVVLSLLVNIVTGAELIEKLKSAGIYEYRVHVLIACIVLSLIFAALLFRQQHAV